MSEPTEPPPTLSYRSPGTVVTRPGLGLEPSDVAVGFVSMVVLVALVAAVVMGEARADVGSAAVVVAAVVIVTAGFGQGVAGGRWGFLVGAGLFAGLVATLGGLGAWLAWK